jgi:hypothetical protein
MGKRIKVKQEPKQEPTVLKAGDPLVVPDWNTPCENCEAVPTVPLTGLCGPCTFGEADTADGNW